MRYSTLISLGAVLLSHGAQAQGPAQQEISEINNAIDAATKICLVGNRFVLEADVNGNLTITKLLPGGAAKVTFRYSDAKGGQFFQDPQVQQLVERAGSGNLHSTISGVSA